MGKSFGSALELADLAAAPANPPSGALLLYMRGGALYQKTSAGVESAIAGSGGGSSFTDPESAPSYAGARTKPFDPATSFYNVTPTSMLPVRAVLAKSQSARVGVSFWGHSIIAGAFSTIGVTDMASQVRRVLNGEGANVSGTGYIPVWQSTSPARDSRWTTFTGWTDSGDPKWPWSYTMAAGAVAIVQSDMPGTIVDVPFSVGMGYGPVAVYIDDVLMETYDPGPGTAGGIVVRSYTGLRNTRHKVELRSTTADPQGTVILGVRVRQATGFEVSNYAMGGSGTMAWRPIGSGGAAGENFAIATASGTPPQEVVFLGVTGNDIIQGLTTEQTRTNMQAIISTLQSFGKAVVLISMSPGRTYEQGGAYPVYTQARHNEMLSMEYDLADLYDLPLLDMTHLLISYPALSARGWMADDIHPTVEAQSLIARSLAQGLLRTQPYDAKPDPMQTEYDAYTPAAPLSGVTLFTRNRARRLPAFIGPSGVDSQLQPALFSNRTARVNAINSAAAPTTDGVAITQLAGTSVAMATTNFFAAMVRNRYSTTATANVGAGVRSTSAQWFTSATPNLGGFFFVCRFGIAAYNATSRIFIGLAPAAVLAPATEPSFFANHIGFVVDAADVNFSFCANDANLGGTKVPLGANFPAKASAATYFYEARIFVPSGNPATYFWSMHRLNDGVITQGEYTDAGNRPAPGTLLGFHAHLANGTTATVASLDVQSIYVETDN